VTSIRPTFGTGGLAAALRTSVIPGVGITQPAATAPAPAATPPAAPPSSGGLLGAFGLPATPAAPAPSAPAAPAPSQPAPTAPQISAISPAVLAALNSSVLTTPPILTLPPQVFVPPILTAPAPQRSVTQLAQDSVAQLRSAARDSLQEAVRTLQAKSIQGKDIMNLLERRTRIGEVLSGSASRWSAETVSDFAAAFQMDATKIGAMDLIVALAALNDPRLESELRSENLPPTTPDEILQNRKVVFQFPPPGTELTPPYVILVAVESQDFSRADDAVNAILGQLVDFQSYKMPRDAAARLG
jgi:hypothetical protein